MEQEVVDSVFNYIDNTGFIPDLHKTLGNANLHISITELKNNIRTAVANPDVRYLVEEVNIRLQNVFVSSVDHYFINSLISKILNYSVPRLIARVLNNLVL